MIAMNTHSAIRGMVTKPKPLTKFLVQEIVVPQGISGSSPKLSEL